MLHKKLIATGIALGTILGTTAGAQGGFSEKPFTDVPTNHEYYEATEYLRSQNVIKGYTDGTFRPDARINRAEFVKLIANPFILDTERLNECIRENIDEDATTVFFPDVRKDSWYAAELCLAKTKKLIDGYPNGTFQPGNYVNFVEAAKIISNTFSLQTEREPAGETWYTPYVRELDEENAIPLGIIRYDQPITRGQMAEMLYRLKTHRTDKPSARMSSLR